MKPGDKVTLELIKPEITLNLELEDYWPYEPSNYTHADQWLAMEVGSTEEQFLDDNNGYWIMLDGSTYTASKPSMMVGTCPEVRDYYHRPDDEL